MQTEGPNSEQTLPDPVDGPLPSSTSWETGYKLNLIALEMLKDRPEFWEERKRRRCDVEFKM